MKKILILGRFFSRFGDFTLLEEHFFECPYCWQQISMLLDLTSGSQNYVEDCEICCNPISVAYECEDAALTSFNAEPLQS